MKKIWRFRRRERLRRSRDNPVRK